MSIDDLWLERFLILLGCEGHLLELVVAMALTLLVLLHAKDLLDLRLVLRTQVLGVDTWAGTQALLVLLRSARWTPERVGLAPPHDFTYTDDSALLHPVLRNVGGGTRRFPVWILLHAA